MSQPVYPRSTHYIAAFLRRKWETCHAWDKDALLDWVQWFVNHQRYLLVTDKGRIVCVAFYRRLDDADQAVEHFTDNNGPVAYVEVAAARSKHAMKAAFNLLRLRETGLTHLAWVRGKYANRATTITIGQAARLLTWAASST